MEPKDIARKAVLGVLGLALLGMLWGRVRAAQGASPAAVETKRGRMGLGAFDNLDGMFSGAASSIEGGFQSKENSLDKAPASAPAGYRGVGDPRAAPAPETPGHRPPPPSVPRKIVRNANATFEIKDHGEARNGALKIAARHGAEVSQDETYESEGCKMGVLAFRVSPDRLDALLKELEPLGRVLHRSVSMQNLTEEYVDLQSRLTNMRKVESRLTQLLSFNTHRLRDVLEVEKEIERVGQDIERILGRMKYIDTLAAQSVLTLNLREPGKLTSQTPGVLMNVKNCVMKAVNTFLTTGLALLDITGFLIAVGLWTMPFAALIWLAWKRYGPKSV